MPTKPTPADQPEETNQICALCRRARLPLQRCSLTGNGDHARRFLLCDDCIRGMDAKSPSARIAQPAAPTMGEAEKRQETRRQKAFERLGTDHPICACCGETDWRCMELHHLEGEQFGKTLITLCRNCHRKLSDVQKDHPAKVGDPPATLERIGHFLLGLADWLVLVVVKLREFGHYLIEEARRQTAEGQEARA